MEDPGPTKTFWIGTQLDLKLLKHARLNITISKLNDESSITMLSVRCDNFIIYEFNLYRIKFKYVAFVIFTNSCITLNIPMYKKYNIR